MRNTTQSPARGQWANCSYQKIVLRPGIGVKVYTVNPAARFQVRTQPERLQGTTRGRIKGFTRWAASRLRELLFRLDYKCAFGMALTSAPWVNRSPDSAFESLRKEVGRCPYLLSAVWRKEVTKKGLVHYHLVVFPTSENTAFHCWKWLASRWVHHIMSAGVCPARGFLVGKKAFRRSFEGVDCWPSSIDTWNAMGREALLAVNASFDLESRTNPGNLVTFDRVDAVRYLCDHTSKHKAYQAETEGRAWGVWNRSKLPFDEGIEISLEDCPPRLHSDILKMLSKLSRYYYLDKDAPFGYRWGRSRRFTCGRKVLFHPSAVRAYRRLVEAWNLRASAEGGECAAARMRPAAPHGTASPAAAEA